MIPFVREFFPGKIQTSGKPRFLPLVLTCLLAVLVATPLFGAEPGAGEANQGTNWLSRITAQYETASGRAKALLAKARASVANSRNIHSRAMSSQNAELRVRARKALLNAEALEKKAMADLAASQSALAVLNRGAPQFAPGVPQAFVALGQDSRYTSGNRAKPKSAAFYGIDPGDLLETGVAGKARLHLLSDGLETDIRLGPDSRLVAQKGEGAGAGTQLVLERGLARFTDTAPTAEAQAAATERKKVLDGFFKCLENGQMDYGKCAYGYLHRVFNRKRFEVRTPSAVLAVRGTDYVLSHDEASGITLLKVLEGEVALIGDRQGHALLVMAGQGARADAKGLILLEAGVDVFAERRRWEE